VLFDIFKCHPAVVENKPNCSSPTPTDQPPLMRSTTKTVVIACVATNERSTKRSDQRLAVWASALALKRTEEVVSRLA